MKGGAWLGYQRPRGWQVYICFISSKDLVAIFSMELF